MLKIIFEMSKIRFFRVKDGGQHILITTANSIVLKDKVSVQTIFDSVFSVP